MLTPAEELGLSGLSLSSRIGKAFFTLPEGTLREMMRRTEEESARRKLSYFRDGVPETVRVLIRPLSILPDQLAYVHYVTLTIQNALKRIPDLYMQDFAVRELLRLSPAEEKWLWDSWGPSHRETNPVFGRLDAMIDLTSPMWKDSLKYVEPNLSGVGGLHMLPTSERILHDVVLPVLEGQDPELTLEIGKDIRELLMQEVVDHLEAIGRKGRCVCFIEPKYVGAGPEEQEELAQYYHERHGMKIFHADPSELTVQRNEVCFGGEAVDIGYRDYEIRDLIELEKQGVDLSPVRMLFNQNRMISSVAGDFDHKSCWEVLTDPQFTQRHFTAEERQVFRRHILWTRVVSDRRTTLPDGTTDDLLSFIRDERETLVLKPNRSYGGDRVAIGHTMSDDEWRAVLESARSGESWVVQQLASIPVCEFPVLGPDGAVHFEPFYYVMGFAPSRYGLSILARASQKQVVNVAQRGGMCAVMIGRPPSELFG